MLLREWKEPIRGDFVLPPKGYDDPTEPRQIERYYWRHRYDLEHFADERGNYLFSEVAHTIDGKHIKTLRGEWDRKRKNFKGGIVYDVDPREIEERARRRIADG